MLSLGSSEKVVPLDNFPQSSVGAPCPGLIATEQALVVVFYLEEHDPAWDGTWVKVDGLESSGEPCAIVHFELASIHTFGPPNDEAFSGHRLAKKGLEPYGAFEVLSSEWVAQLEKMNSVHPMHNRERFLNGKRHFILTFHDSVFECVAKGYTVELASGSVKEQLIAAAQKLNG